jgi:hypothetical protein
MTTKNEPRWTPGSLAEAIGRRPSRRWTQADAVERLTRAVARLRDATEECRTCEPGRTPWAALWTAIDEAIAAGEAAEKWGGR